MYLSKDFTLNELLITDYTKYTEQFKPGSTIIANLTKLATTVLQPLRDTLDNGIYVSSGYRCIRLNQAVGGSKTSVHTLGLAADLYTKYNRSKGQYKTNYDLFKLACIKIKELNIDQIIHEYGKDGNPAWVHIGLSASDNPRHQILIKRKGQPYRSLTLDQALKLA